MKKETTIKPPVEILFADELEALRANDTDKRPTGWLLSPQAVKMFISGSNGKKLELKKGSKHQKIEISRKFYGEDILIERSIITLLGNRGLLLVGEPGTAKTMLSELLTAAISGNTHLTVQGTAGTTEDQIKYSWNYAMLLSEGPNTKSLVPGPIYTGFKTGSIVRFEEITRCQPEIQDVLVSILSEKCMVIPELPENDSVLQAERGFNIIATANLRDRGVNEMSSALKRRFNFETIQPVSDKNLEMKIVKQQTELLLKDNEIDIKYSEDTLDLLITTFQDLRTGKTHEGASIEKPSTVMSTAEAVAVSLSACLDAHYFGNGKLNGEHITRQMVGTVFKDDPNDAKKLEHYLKVIAKTRSKKGGVWKAFYESRHLLE